MVEKNTNKKIKHDSKIAADRYIYINSELDHDLLNNKKTNSLKEKKEFSKVSEILDKYYTKPEIAKLCYNKLVSILPNKDNNNSLFIEPSAGSGSFLDVIDANKIGFDLAPTRNDKHHIYKANFLIDDITSLINENNDIQKVFIGNPPFGTKAKLAIEFVNKCLTYSNIVGFILPLQFRKWSVQSKINKDAILILDETLPDNSFAFMGKDYNVRCCFQIWILPTFESKLPNLRISSKPATVHPDFEMYQYNRTEEAKKYFDYDWDFAVYRQGYLDYKFKSFKKEDCNMKQQWIFFKANNQDTLDKLLALDFEKLSKKNIGIPGFGKADVVEEYNQIFKNK